MELQKQENNNIEKRFKDSPIASKQFKASLLAICYNLGIRDIPDDKDLDNRFNFLKRNFGLLRINDIDISFELYSAQELDFKDSHFNSFDNVFIGKVLKSYQEWKQKEAKKPKLLKPIGMDIQIDEPKKTKEQYAEDEFKHLDENYEKALKGFMLVDWNAAYWWMLTNKIIEVDKDTLEMFAENVRADIEHDIKVRKAERRDFKLEQKILDHPKSFKIECRKRYLINYYENKA
jgi:hypothetical protein